MGQGTYRHRPHKFLFILPFTFSFLAPAKWLCRQGFLTTWAPGQGCLLCPDDHCNSPRGSGMLSSHQDNAASNLSAGHSVDPPLGSPCLARSNNDLEVNPLTSLRAESWQSFLTYILTVPRSALHCCSGSTSLHTLMGDREVGIWRDSPWLMEVEES